MVSRDGDYAAVGVLMAIISIAGLLWLFDVMGISSIHGGGGFAPSVSIGICVGIVSAWASSRDQRWMNFFGSIIALTLGLITVRLIVTAIG